MKPGIGRVSRPSSPAAWIWAGVLFVSALILFGMSASRMVFPPGNDTTYYLLNARNLAAGQGLQEDVVWHYLREPPDLPQQGNDYWMPLVSFVIEPFISVWGEAYTIALVPMVLLGALTVVLCFCFAQAVLRSVFLGVACSIAYLFSSRTLAFSTSTDTAIPYTFLVLTVMMLFGSACEASGDKRGRLQALVMGVVCGLAALTRADAVLVLPVTMVLSAAWMRRFGPSGLDSRQLGLAAMGFVAVLSPWVVRNLVVFGTPWNPAVAKAAMLTEYAEFFSYGDRIEWGSWWASVATNPLGVAKSKLVAVIVVIRDFVELTSPYVMPFLVSGAIVLVRSREPRVIFAFAFLVALSTLYVLLGDTAGGSYHSMLAVLPLALSSLAAGLRWLWIRAVARRVTWANVDEWSGSRRGAILSVLLLGLLSSRLWQLPADHEGEKQRSAYRQVLSSLRLAGFNEEEPVMSLQPLQTSYATDYRAIMVPSNGLDAVCAAAGAYAAQTLLLNGYFLDSPGYEELSRIYEGRLEDARFEPILSVNGWRLFRIRCRR